MNVIVTQMSIRRRLKALKDVIARKSELKCPTTKRKDGSKNEGEEERKEETADQRSGRPWRWKEIKFRLKNGAGRSGIRLIITQY